jgi:hypothetical protein
MTTKQEYINIFNQLKQEWRFINICPWSNGFNPDQLKDYIYKRSALISRLGVLHRELGL